MKIQEIRTSVTIVYKKKRTVQKVLTLDIDNQEDLMQVMDKIKKRVNDQDEKVNKHVK